MGTRILVLLTMLCVTVSGEGSIRGKVKGGVAQAALPVDPLVWATPLPVDRQVKSHQLTTLSQELVQRT